MRRTFVALVVCGAAAGGCAASRTRVVVAYRGTEPVHAVTINVVDATGHGLPLPQVGLIERALRFVTRQPSLAQTIPDAFATAAAERLAQLHVRIATADSAPAQRLEINLTGWDRRDDNASGGVAFVSASYQLLDEHGTVLWAVEQDKVPVRLNGPNLSRYDVARIARACVEVAFDSLPTPGVEPEERAHRCAPPVTTTPRRGSSLRSVGLLEHFAVDLA